MKRNRPARWAVIAILAFAPLLSCPKESPQEILILDAAAVTRQTQCMVRTGAAPQFIWLNGVLDLAITNHYWLFPHFKNLLPTIQEVSEESVTGLYPRETHYVNIHKAYVHVNLGAFYSVLGTSEQQYVEFLRVDGLEVPVALGIEPGAEGTVAVEVIPTDLGNLLRKKVLAYPGASHPGIWITVVVQLEGRTQDLWSVHSNEFEFPIKVCYGCLIRPTTNDPSATPTAGNIPCFPGQDEGVDDLLCRLVALDKDACFPGE